MPATDIAQISALVVLNQYGTWLRARIAFRARLVTYGDCVGDEWGRFTRVTTGPRFTAGHTYLNPFHS